MSNEPGGNSDATAPFGRTSNMPLDVPYTGMFAEELPTKVADKAKIEDGNVLSEISASLDGKRSLLGTRKMESEFQSKEPVGSQITAASQQLACGPLRSGFAMDSIKDINSGYLQVVKTDQASSPIVTGKYSNVHSLMLWTL